MSEIEMRAWQDSRLEIRETPDGPSRIVGRAVPFGELSLDLGGWREIIVAGAFDVADKDIRSPWQHDASMVMGSTRVPVGGGGVVVDLSIAREASRAPPMLCLP